MLVELAVRDLGVISDVTLTPAPGCTALTGETGAGKTLLVAAVELLVGGRADAGIVRAGASEARVEGRFVDADGNELVLTRVVPLQGRSRSYLDGRMVPVTTLAEVGARLVDLHGQHAHQSLLGASVQRDALDRFAGVDLTALKEARGRLVALDSALASLGGDSRERAREIDLLTYQLDEIDAAGLVDPMEESALEVTEEALANAFAHREAAGLARDLLVRDGGVSDLLGEVLHHLAGRVPFAEVEQRLRAQITELDDLGAELRTLGEALEDDPRALDEVRSRRRVLRELRRRYGETIGDVILYADQARHRLHELCSHDQQVAELEERRARVLGEVASEESKVEAHRRSGAPGLSRAVEDNLAALAMGRARFRVDVDGLAGERVQFLLAANKGEDFAPLAKAASGGELARTMLALRLALLGGRAGDSDAPVTNSTLIFDEVDAGIGGEAAQEVGRALASLARDSQVLVVTHLAQVAACADEQIVVTKSEVGDRTVASAALVELDDRVVELSRMLSGRPDSATARDHARELLERAAEVRAR